MARAIRKRRSASLCSKTLEEEASGTRAVQHLPAMVRVARHLYTLHYSLMLLLRAADELIGSEIFESALAEILPKGECYSLNIQSTRPQRVQFVHTENKFCNLLFFLEREFVHLYQILYRRRQNGGYHTYPALYCIIKRSFLLSLIAAIAVSASLHSLYLTPRFRSSLPGMNEAGLLHMSSLNCFLFRCEWDGRRDTLYLLTNKPKEEQTHIFKAIQIQKSHKVVCELPISIPFDLTTPELTPFNIADVCVHDCSFVFFLRLLS